MSFRLLLLFSVFTFASTGVLADFAPGDWRYEKDIAALGGGAPYVSVLFDQEVFTHAASGLRDLRVLSGDAEVPYQLVVERSTQSRESVAGRLFNLATFTDETSFQLEVAESGVLHNGVTMTTPSENFRREVVVEGSNDGQQWGILTQSGFIYDVTVRHEGRIDFRTQATAVSYPETTFRFLKVRILDRGEEPIRITGAGVFAFQDETATAVSYPLVLAERSENAEERATQLVFDTGAAGLPTNQLTLTVREENFNRRVGLEGSNDRDQWQVLTPRDVMFRYRTPKFTGEKLAVSYRESSFRYFRLTIFNEDNPALSVSGANASGLLRRLVFPYDPTRTYILAYGNPDARYPSYDLAAYFQYLETANLPEVSLSPERSSASFREKAAPIPPLTERFPWLVPAALAAVVAFFVLVLVRLLRSLKGARPS